MPRLTVKEFLDLKGKRQLTEVLVTTPEEAAACEAAGIDLIITGLGGRVKEIRDAAPNTFLTLGLRYGDCASGEEAIRAGFKALDAGADAVYACMSTEFIAGMAREGIPVVGHVGLIPQKRTWTGGFRAVGKTAEQALWVYQHTRAHEEAGAIGVEMEVVPHQIAAEITKRVKLLVISMGSGPDCDAQYLFAMDILGSHRNHIPRHAKVYRDFYSEQQRLQQERIAAFKEYAEDVQSRAFPGTGNIVEAQDEEYAKFLDALEKL
ncbi:MAG: 3-methyl-2-oxobutanoate hydroxymethyltransferase [Caldilineaceae bacterium]